MKSSIPIGGDETDRKNGSSHSLASAPPTNGHSNGKMHNGNGTTPKSTISSNGSAGDHSSMNNGHGIKSKFF